LAVGLGIADMSSGRVSPFKGQMVGFIHAVQYLRGKGAFILFPVMLQLGFLGTMQTPAPSLGFSEVFFNNAGNRARLVRIMFVLKWRWVFLRFLVVVAIEFFLLS